VIVRRNYYAILFAATHVHMPKMMLPATHTSFLKVIVIVIVILIHYHKKLTCRRIESAYRFIGLAFSSHFLFLHSVSHMYIQLCKAIKKNSQPGAGERGGGTRVTCNMVFVCCLFDFVCRVMKTFVVGVVVAVLDLADVFSFLCSLN
jgi:hypothetical protein